MDFWEGLFLGPIWLDSHYADQKHGLFNFAFAILALVLAVAFVFVPRFAFLTSFPVIVYLLPVLLGLLGLPFAAAHYPALAWYYKILILAAYALQYFVYWLFFARILALVLANAPKDILLLLGEKSNQLMNDFASFFGFLGKLSANFAGLAAGSLLSLCVLLLVGALLLFLPLLFFAVLRRLQRLCDRYVMRKYFRSHAAF